MSKNNGVCFKIEKGFWPNYVHFQKFDLYQVGEICCERNYEVIPHVQPCSEISYIISGRGTFYTNGIPLTVNPGEIIINKKGQLHSIIPEAGQKLRYAFLGFNMSENNLPFAWKAVSNFYLNTNRQKTLDRTDLMALFSKAINEFYTTSELTPLFIEIYVEHIILATYNNFYHNKDIFAVKDKKQSSFGEIIYSVVRYINEHIMTITGITQVAEKLGYNESYLSRYFHEKTNITLQQYIIEMKMSKAVYMMKYENLPLTKIAEALQYQSVQSLSRAFKRTVGVSPREYLRRQTANDSSENGVCGFNTLRTIFEECSHNHKDENTR